MNKPTLAKAAPTAASAPPLSASRSALRAAAPAVLNPDPPKDRPPWDLVESELRRVFAFPLRSNVQALVRSLEAMRRLWPPSPAAPAP